MEPLPIVGAALYILGWLWCVVIAFKEGFLWGAGSLFIPIVWLFYAASRWRNTWVPLLMVVLGAVIFFSSGGKIPT